MSAELLIELEQAGIRLSRSGDSLRYQTRPSVSIAPFREQIIEHKSELIAALIERETVPTVRLNAARKWVSVHCGPVEASTPPADWRGEVPTGCGVPQACRTLGPCPYHAIHDQCWNEQTP